DQCRLDHVLSVKEVVAIGLVETNMNSPTDLRKHHQSQICVLNVHRVPRLMHCRLGNAINEWNWIEAATAALIHTSLKKHRITIGRMRQVALQHDRLPPRFDRTTLFRWRWWKLHAKWK